MGGGERVHCEILNSFKAYSTYTYFIYPSKNTFHLQNFQDLSECKDISNRSANSWILNIRIGIALASIQNGSNVLISGVPEMYQWCRIAKHLRFIDLIHWGATYHFQKSIKYIHYLQHRVVITKTLKFQLARIYMKYGLSDYISRIVYIANGIDIPVNLNAREDKLFKVLYIGRNDPIKRIHLIGEIAKMLKLPVEFCVCGCNKNDFSAEHQGYLNIVGILQKNELEQYYQKSHAILITSLSEGFPLALMEAMAYGVIPISTNVGSISEHITHGYNGFLIDKNKSQEIIQEFVHILNNLIVGKVMRKNMSEAAYRYASQHFSRNNFSLSYRKLLLDKKNLNSKLKYLSSNNET